MKQTTAFLKESKTTVMVVMTAFLCGILLGAAAYPHLKEQTRELADALKNIVVGETKPLMAVKIFLKNVEASFITLILGPTILLPLLVVFSNGFAAGLITRMVHENGKPLAKITLGLIPHGIFELTAFFLTAAAGMKIGLAAVNPKGKPRIKAAKEAAKNALKVYVKMVIPLLLIAAIVETYVSTQLIQ